MEHDVYCMFEALMNNAHGLVPMGDLFSSSSIFWSYNPSVIEYLKYVMQMMSSSYK